MWTLIVCVLFALSSLLTTITAHGFVQQIRFGDTLVEGWNPYKDPQKKPAVNKITRKFKDNGPVTDGKFMTDAGTCGIGIEGANNIPVTASASVPAGSVVTFIWTEWKSDHPGPVMTYLAKCPGKCSDFKGSTGNVWVKIDQAGYDASKSTPWASKRLPLQNSTWTVKLPSSIVSGEYILRHEILGLQRTNKEPTQAQFYPSCHQIIITGGGTKSLPAGIAIPGAFKLDDRGIALNYRDISASKPYTPPGGPVWSDNGWRT
ncbi:family 61 endoglucanase [Tothia fuscella]|uniref:lytic cellulose monooxygenase (C4-dehydrogenating) n=1 Tax=Tothia fuscella TaxID=1048955 RepID=A0A9P4TY29_9PEZI|nr:family 61 endoglucanase [Tothia fuscella]